MGFIMAGLDAENYDRQYSDRELLRRILGYFRPAAAAMVLVGVMITLHSVMQMVQPLAISWGIDRLVDDDADEVIWLLAGIILAAGVLGWLFNFIRQSVTARVVGDVVLALRTDAFDATMDRDLSFYDTNPSGKVVSRVTSDTDDFANVVTLTMNLLSQILLVFIVIGILYSRNAYLATVARNMDCECFHVGGVADHVHLAVRLSRTITMAQLIEKLKTSSSKWLKTQSPALAAFAWQRGYGAFSVGPSDINALLHYIDTQEEHHRTRTFQDEYRDFLKKYGIEYDERYVWD